MMIFLWSIICLVLLHGLGSLQAAHFTISDTFGRQVFDSELAANSLRFFGNDSFVLKLIWDGGEVWSSVQRNTLILAPHFDIEFLDSPPAPNDNSYDNFDVGAVYQGHITDVVGARGSEHGSRLGWISFAFINPDSRGHQMAASPLIEGEFYLSSTGSSFSILSGSSNSISVIETPFDPSNSSQNLYSCDQKAGLNSLTADARAYTPGFTGCQDNALRTLYMGIAVDCTFIQKAGSVAQATQKVLSLWNAVDAIFRSELNINLGLAKIVYGSATCNESPKWNSDCKSTLTMSTRLEEFSSWRIQNQDASLGLWHLLTDCTSANIVGVSWLNRVCQTGPDELSIDGSKITGAGVSYGMGKTSAAIVAHEIGHSFGASHDCPDDSTCPSKGSCTDCYPTVTPDGGECLCCSSTGGSSCSCKGKYLMSPTLGQDSAPAIFSECSKRQICAQIYQSTFKCLFDPGSRPTLNGSATCGNGIKETGEQCDCGQKCSASSCCTEKCVLKSNAKCSPENDPCCTSECKIASKYTVCRQSTGDCDVPEKCDGTNTECPVDSFAPDGNECEVPGYTCASGKCTSRDHQCSIYGKAWSSSASCAEETSCLLSCKLGGNGCFNTPSNFIDGTPCGSDSSGKCLNGTCQYKHWFWRWGWIAVVALGSCLVLYLIYECIYKRLARKKRQESIEMEVYE